LSGRVVGGSSWLGVGCEVREGAHGTPGVRKEFGMVERSDGRA